MKTVKYEVTFDEKASRLELFIRWVWLIPTYIVLVLIGIVAWIMIVLQWFHILFLGKKHKTLYEWTGKYMKYVVNFMTYFYLMTEERNAIMPEDL